MYAELSLQIQERGDAVQKTEIVSLKVSVLEVTTESQRAVASVHAPGQWRTNVPVMNQTAFGEAFGCKAGTPMQPTPEMQVKLWP